MILLTTLSTAFAQLPAEAEIKSQIDPELAAGMQVTVVVKFNDRQLEYVIRQALLKLTGDITDADMAKITHLYAEKKNIRDLTGLEYAINMKGLQLDNNQIKDISVLRGLTRMIGLHMKNNQISDISALKYMTAMRDLYLDNNHVSDISPLKNLTKMDWLSLSNNQVSDISILQYFIHTGWDEFRYLDLSHNQIKDISSLQNKNINKLYLSYNQIDDISSLNKTNNPPYPYFWVVDLKNNYISDISALSNKRIYYLCLDNNKIFDIRALKNRMYANLELKNNQLANDDLDNIGRMDALQKLTLNGNPGITSGTVMENLAKRLKPFTCQQIEWDGKCDVDPNKVAIVRFYPDSIEFGDTLTVETTATDSEGELVQVQMNWGDGTVSEYSKLMFNASTFTFRHRYLNGGKFIIQAIARDQFGNETEWSTPVEVFISGKNSPPLAIISRVTPRPAEPNQTVTLQTIATDPESHQVMLQVD